MTSNPEIKYIELLTELLWKSIRLSAEHISSSVCFRARAYLANLMQVGFKAWYVVEEIL